MKDPFEILNQTTLRQQGEIERLKRRVDFIEPRESQKIYGEIYAHDVADTIAIAGIGEANKVQVTSFTTNGLFNFMTPDHTNDHIIVLKAGIYFCAVSISAESGAGAAFEAGFGVYKNNGATGFDNLHSHRNLSGGGGDTGSITISGIVNLAINDTIELWVWNETNVVDVIINDVTLSLILAR